MSTAARRRWQLETMTERAKKDDRPSLESEPARARRADLPAPKSTLMELQRTAGNQAVVEMLRRREDGSATIRREGGPGAAAPAEAAPAAAGPDAAVPAAPADRTAKNAEGKTQDDLAAIANPELYLKNAGSKWDEARARFKKGWLGFVAGGDDGKGTFDASKGLGMNALIAFRLQSTVLKKSDVSSSNSPMEQIQTEVTAKQIAEREQRQAALREAGVMKDLPPPKPLDWNYGAGSGTATSDIDVNLQGDATEHAVSAFNAMFRKAWGTESGSVFDVNVYARDYLPSGALGAEGKKDLAGPGEAGTKDLSAEDWQAKGVTFETSRDESTDAGKKASASQEVFSLLKTRKDMSRVDWARFKLEQMAALGSDEAGREAKMAAFTEAETKYEAREAAIKAKVAKADADAKVLLGAKPEGAPKPSGDAAADKRLAAENALYEENLTKVAAVRGRLVVAKELLAAGSKPASYVEEISAELQEALHGAAMYANEAYITGAAVLHVVGNLQMLGKSKLSIGLSGADYLASANEQVGFIFDDLHREVKYKENGLVDQESVAAGLLKAGKYIQRLGHAAGKVEAAAKGSGKVAAPIAHPTCEQVTKYGDKLMGFKSLEPDKQKAAAREAKEGDFSLGKLGLNQVKAEILKFQSKLQSLAGKL